MAGSQATLQTTSESTSSHELSWLFYLRLVNLLVNELRSDADWIVGMVL